MKLPAFKMENQDGVTVTEQDLLGQTTILYFYPRDNTPTCTNQALDFTEHADELKALGATVIGVNGDSKKKHQNFIAKHNLKIELLVDEEYELAKALNIYRLKKVFGRESMGIVRTTLIVGPDLEIEKRFDDVKVKTQLEDIRAYLEDMK